MQDRYNGQPDTMRNDHLWKRAGLKLYILAFKRGREIYFKLIYIYPETVTRETHTIGEGFC